MQQFQTPQENFWATTFGDDYTQRNQGAHIIAGNIALFSKILSRTTNVTSVMEFGANTGLNLQAIQSILPNAELSGLEINENAIASLNNIKKIKTNQQSLINFTVD
ncbi:MAG: hypothetical protein V1855_02690 [bacterium]